jgi:hypothetical protein
MIEIIEAGAQAGRAALVGELRRLTARPVSVA